MAIASLGTVTTAGNQSSGATLVSAAVSISVPVGAVIVVCVAADNAGASGAKSTSAPSDSQGNTYNLVNQTNRTPGSAAADGTTASVYAARVTTALASGVDTITGNFSPNTTAKSFVAIAFSGMEDIAYSNSGVTGSGTTYNNGNTATASLASGDIVIGAVAVESNTAATADSDTSNGSWVATTAVSGGTGGDATKMSVSFQYKIVTGSGAQTLNGSCANTDWAVGWGLFTVPTAKSDTESGTGTDAGSVDVGSQPSDGDTGSGADAGESLVITENVGPSDDPATGADAGESISVATTDTEVGKGYDDGRFIWVEDGGDASGVTPGTGGRASASHGDITFSGGSGAPGTLTAGSAAGGGGGSSAGSAADGVTATGQSGTTAPTDGGNGGAGGNAGATGANGSTPGGAGGGGGVTAATSTNGGTPGNRRAIFTYQPSGTVSTRNGFNFNEVPPAGSTSVRVQLWGAAGTASGGSAGVRSGAGGGGAAYAESTITIDGTWRFASGIDSTVTPNLSYIAGKNAPQIASSDSTSNNDPATAADTEALAAALSEDDPGAGVDAESSLVVSVSDTETASAADAGSVVIHVVSTATTTGCDHTNEDGGLNLNEDDGIALLEGCPATEAVGKGWPDNEINPRTRRYWEEERRRAALRRDDEEVLILL